MHVNADALAASLTGMWEYLTPAIAGSRVVRKGGAVALVTGIPVPTLNSVWFEQPDPRSPDVTALLDELAASGALYTMGVRQGSAEIYAGLAAQRGMKPRRGIPLMALDGSAGLRAIREPEGLTVCQLGPHEAPLHAEVAAAGFGATRELLLRLAGPEVLGLDCVRCYLGEAGGQPAATGIGVTPGAFTAIFNVATVPHLRGRGFSTAITARAVADGLNAGAAWCWLQSSADGYPVYRDLGFQTVESWSYWLAGS
jgi:hypothetical protein